MTADGDLRFAYRLALAIGRVDVRRMMDDMTAEEADGWAEYYELEPWGESRADLRTGLAAATIGNLLAEGKPFTPAHFMWNTPSPATTGEHEDVPDFDVATALYVLDQALAATPAE